MRRRKGTDNARLIRNRRVMSTSSGFTSSAVTVRGSSAIPQMGQLPGSDRTISGCIGQVHSVRVAATAAVTGSSAIPHVVHVPGPICRTSGSMGHVCSTACCAAGGTGGTRPAASPLT